MSDKPKQGFNVFDLHTAPFDLGRRFAFAAIRPDLTIDRVSDNFGELVGSRDHPSSGRPLGDVLWEFVGSESFLEAMLIGDRDLYRLDHVNVGAKDGSVRYLTYQVSPADERRPGAGLILLVEDTTDYGGLHQKLVQERNELRLVRQRLAQTNDELQQVSRMKSLFLSMAAHDLGSPLTSIMCFAELLRQAIEGQRQKSYLDAISAQSDRLRRLIADLLDLDQIEQGKLNLAKRNCMLNEVIGEVIMALGPAIEMHSQSLDLDLPDPSPILCADPDRLAQVIYNLVDNAVKYSPEGAQISVGARARMEAIVIEVADNGYGMTGDQVANLFELYYRTPDSRERGLPGTGLGLYIVKSLVEAHEGDIAVQSSPGEGSVFTIRLPKGSP